MNIVVSNGVRILNIETFGVRILNIEIWGDGILNIGPSGVISIFGVVASLCANSYLCVRLNPIPVHVNEPSWL